MKTLVIFHADCWDGFCAAWLFKKAYPEAEFHAAHYGTEPPDVTVKRVFVVDFSYRREHMLLMAGSAAELAVLDHHRTAEADLDGFADECERGYGLPRPTVVFDMNKSGGRLAWEFLQERAVRLVKLLNGYVLSGDDGFFIDTDEGNGLVRMPAPWLVDYTEDRDLWRHRLEKSREINAALRSYPLDFAEWDRLDPDGPFHLVPEGAALLRAERQVIDRHVRHARDIELAGHTVPAVNATVLFSEIAGELAKGKPFGACYFDRFDGSRVWSLRSEAAGVDVSDVAKQFGGGGHPHSAGFEEVQGRATIRL